MGNSNGSDNESDSEFERPLAKNRKRKVRSRRDYLSMQEAVGWNKKQRYEREIAEEAESKHKKAAALMANKDIGDILAEALGGLGLKERVALRTVSKQFRSIEECDSIYWRSMLRDEDAKGWSTETLEWIKSDGGMQAWMEARGYALDSPCLASEVFVRAPQFRARMVLYTDSNWRQYAALAGCDILDSAFQNRENSDASLLWQEKSVWIRRNPSFQGNSCLPILVSGGWIDVDLDLMPLIRDPQSEGILKELIATSQANTGMFAFLTNPNIKGSDGVRMTFQTIFPRNLPTEGKVERFYALLDDHFFPRLFQAGAVSVSAWLGRPADEVAIWDSVRRNTPRFYPSKFWAYMPKTVEALLSRKRQIEPDTSVRMVFYERLPKFDIKNSALAARSFVDWIEHTVRLVPVQVGPLPDEDTEDDDTEVNDE